ncbi:hypothetical protein [Amphritea balenae]|uniref:PQ-loop repeat-containing protein n=1 Tax=Amphritea balenae TaxID=452629 RepID=A0A3P1SS79_9GAMM|nr:hypothetical protein [Amphritea balenae]RRC99970.1 hypothetical protein EHS89_07075 [Amphritea balenae]GGK75466.1 hypothetical protein GCM10007941_27030 [Amphritea balenae]
MLYNAVGMLSSVFFIGCLFGLIDQIRRIRKRKLSVDSQHEGFATQSISANAFFSSFIAFYAFFLYSFMLDEVEYYILVTRFFAASMTLVILYEIYTDRQAFSQKLPFITGIICMTLAGLAYLYREDVLVLGRSTSIILACGATLVMLQGGIQQIRRIIKERSTGVLSLPMNAIFMAKDLSNVAFGMVLGISDGWPLIMLGSISALLKLSIILQFFYYRKTQHKSESSGN